MQNNYVLITAAKNEAVFIESTIKSVVAQTLLPKKWIIVSDQSTDGTDEIVNKYSNEQEERTFVYESDDIALSDFVVVHWARIEDEDKNKWQRSPGVQSAISRIKELMQTWGREEEDK